MLFLFPVMPENAEAQLRESPSSFRPEALEGIFEGIWEAAGHSGSTANVMLGEAADRDGNVYTEVNLQVTGRFVRNGERFLLANSVAVDFDALMAVARESAKLARKISKK